MEIYLYYYIRMKAGDVHFPHSHEIVDEKLKYVSTEYEFVADITFEVMLNFAINEIGLSTYQKWEENQRYGFVRGIQTMWLNGFISKEQLEKNKNFMDFIQEYFSYDALTQYESEQEDV